MKLHLVGGFLGSGKTTAIIGAARALAARGLRVGVVTNDQGKYLVDTAFFQAAQVPTVEVTGGCFCCNYDDLAARLDQLKESAQPDVVFAESVGSCADLVATVLKPLLQLAQGFAPASFSVFADCRLLRRRWLDEPMPFSDEVMYVFDQQIEEAGLLVVNKVDLLAVPALDELRGLAEARYPGKAVLFHSAVAEKDVPQSDLLQLDLTGQKRPVRSMVGIEDWLALIESGAAVVPQASLQIDYPRYGAGEARLAWLDMGMTLTFRAGEGRAVLLRLLGGMLERLAEHGVGHLKLLVRGEDEAQVKLSLTAETQADWQALMAQVPQFSGEHMHVLLNARAELAPEELLALVQAALAGCGAEYTVERVDSFAPGFPVPQHRMG